MTLLDKEPVKRVERLLKDFDQKQSIIILDNPVEKGYARQNDLVPENWISIYFEGELPIIINAQITDIKILKLH